jgi:hypothetical protein
MRKLSLPIFLCVLRVEWGMHDGQAVQWPFRSLAGILRLSVSLLTDVFSVVTTAEATKF